MNLLRVELNMNEAEFKGLMKGVVLAPSSCLLLFPLFADSLVFLVDG